MKAKKQTKPKAKKRKEPAFFLCNQFGQVIGAHFRELAACHHGVDEAWGLGELARILPPDKLLGMKEPQICLLLKKRLSAIGFSVIPGEVTFNE